MEEEINRTEDYSINELGITIKILEKYIQQGTQWICDCDVLLPVDDTMLQKYSIFVPLRYLMNIHTNIGNKWLNQFYGQHSVVLYNYLGETFHFISSDLKQLMSDIDGFKKDLVSLLNVIAKYNLEMIENEKELEPMLFSIDRDIQISCYRKVMYDTYRSEIQIPIEMHLPVEEDGLLKRELVDPSGKRYLFDNTLTFARKQFLVPSIGEYDEALNVRKVYLTYWSPDTYSSDLNTMLGLKLFKKVIAESSSLIKKNIAVLEKVYLKNLELDKVCESKK